MSSKISGLTPGTATSGDEVYANRAGADFRITVQDIAALAYPVAMANIGATGTPSATTILRGDGTWSTGVATWTVTTNIADAFRMGSGGVITETTTARTLSAGDNGKVIYCTNAGAVTITTAASLGAAFSCTLIQGGAGQITVAQGASTTRVGYNGQYKSAGQYAFVAVFCPVADTFIVGGMTTA